MITSEQVMRRPSVIAALVTLVLAATVGYLVYSRQSTPSVTGGVHFAAEDKEFKDIPIPFIQKGNLGGNVTYFGKRNNLDVYAMTFGSENENDFTPDDVIFFVVTPSDRPATILPVDLFVFKKGVNSGGDTVGNLKYFGYKYTSRTADTERNNQGNVDFRVSFPGVFYISPAQKVDDPNNDFPKFETDHHVTFVPTDDGHVMLQPDSLYIFVMNTPSTKLKLNPPPVCGNRWVEAGEECDYGPPTGAARAGCTPTCHAESGWQCTNNSCTPVNPASSAASSTGNTSSANTCTTSCTQGSTRCNADGHTVETCTMNQGCTQWTATTVCTASNMVCQAGTCVSIQSSCGNGVTEQGETCDDGNSAANDGCSPTCQVENGYNCTTNGTTVANPSICAKTCGDGHLDTAIGEECDLGTNNGQPGTLCTNECKLIIPF